EATIRVPLPIAGGTRRTPATRRHGGPPSLPRGSGLGRRPPAGRRSPGDGATGARTPATGRRRPARRRDAAAPRPTSRAGPRVRFAATPQATPTPARRPLRGGRQIGR